MEGGEDNEENPGETEAPIEGNEEPESTKEPTPVPTPEPDKEPTPVPTPEPDKEATPDPTADASPNLSKEPTPVSASKTASPANPSSRSSAAKIMEKIDEAEEPILEKKMLLQESGALKAGACSKGVSAFPIALGDCAAGGLFKKRSPFIHDPPQPEERRPRISHPSTPREYIINLREGLADFQETHGLPRTRDYSFLSLGLALAQETARAICSIFLMFTELFPILAIVSLILRFALDKLIEILETPDVMDKSKKAVIFVAEMVVIVIPLWILVGSIVLPLVSLMFSILAKMLRLKKGKKPCSSK